VRRLIVESRSGVEWLFVTLSELHTVALILFPLVNGNDKILYWHVRTYLQLGITQSCIYPYDIVGIF